MQLTFFRKTKTIKWAVLAAFVVLYILVRLNAIFTPAISGWTTMVDEMPTGNIAHDLDDGLVLHFPLYQFKPFAAGTMLQGLLAWPFMKALGHSLFALKLTAIFIGLCTMLLWLALLWRYVGSWAAFVAGLLFVFPPLGYLNLTTTAWGNHAESSLFTAACLLLIFWAYSDRNPAKAPPFLPIFLAGLVAGFGTYFTYTTTLTLVFGLMLIFFVGGAVQWRGPVWYYLGGAVVGISPILNSIRTYGWAALGRIDTYSGYSGGSLITFHQLFAEKSFFLPFVKFFDAWVRDMPRSLCFPDFLGIPGYRLSFFFYGFFLLGLILWVLVSRKELFLLLKRLFSGRKTKDHIRTLLLAAIPGFIVFFLVGFSFSAFRVIDTARPVPASFIEYRYFAPLYPFFFAVMGISVQAMADRGREKITWLIPAAAVPLFAVALTVAIVFSMMPGKKNFQAMQVRGDYYELIVSRIAMEISKHEEQVDGKILWIEQVSPEFRALFFEHLSAINPSAFHLALYLEGRMNLPVSLKTACFRGYGRYVGKGVLEKTEGDAIAGLASILDKAVNYGGESREAFLEGAAEGMYFSLQPYLGVSWHLANLVKWTELWNTVPDHQDRRSLMSGIGRGIGASFQPEGIDDIKPEPGFWFGVGRQLRRNAKIQLLNNEPVSNSIERFPPDMKPFVYKGWIREQREIFMQGRVPTPQ